MTTKEEHREDLQNCIDDFPQPFTYGALDCIGTRTPVTSRTTLEDGGYMNEYDVYIWVGNEKRIGYGPDGHAVWQPTFTSSKPVLGEKITMDSVVYRIERISPDEINVGIRLDLETDQK